MSDIVVRPYEPRDQEQTWHVRAMTYNNGRPIPVEEQVYKTSTPYVAELDGRVVGTYVIMDMTSTRGALAEWKTAGIAGVAVLPELRQAGVGSAMMRYALRSAKDQGYVLASLYAFRESYYRRFGYELCGYRQKIVCENARLPRLKSELPIRRLPHSEFGAIKACYESWARSYSGMNLRTDMHWGRLLNETKHIYVAGDPAEAYAIVEHDWSFWQPQNVAEFGWSSARGYRSLLSFLGSLGINKTSVSWYEPSDGPFMTSFMDQGVALSAERMVMYRLLDPRAALTSLVTDAQGAFSMAIDDPDLPENSEPIEVHFGGGRVDVKPCESADLRFTPQTAVQAFLGQPGVSGLARQGLLQGGGISDAARLLPYVPVYCVDFF